MRVGCSPHGPPAAATILGVWDVSFCLKTSSRKRANFGASFSLRLLLIAFRGMTSLDVRCEHYFLFFYCVFKLFDFAFKLEAGSSEPFFVWGDNPRPRPTNATLTGKATGRTLANFQIGPLQGFSEDLWTSQTFYSKDLATRVQAPTHPVVRHSSEWPITEGAGQEAKGGQCHPIAIVARGLGRRRWRTGPTAACARNVRRGG